MRMNSWARRSGTALLVMVAATLTATTGCTTEPAQPPPAAGTSTAVPLLDGDSRQIPAGHPLLLAFLDPAAAAGASSRSQIPVLRSMATQYGPAGVTVLIVDATGKASHDDLVNFAHDWDLRQPSIAIAAPAGAADLTQTYRATAVPDTLLIGPDGAVRQRWRGNVAKAQDLALALQALLPPTPAPSVS